MHPGKLSTIALLALVLWLGGEAAWPQAEVTALVRDAEPLAETTDLACTRFASFEDLPSVRVGLELEPGDLLASVSGATDLELTCPGGSLLRFSDNFRVLVDVPGEGSDCAVDFLSGTLDVLTDQPTEVNAGGVVLGTEGTQYTVELLVRDGAAEQDCKVWDGRVRWRARGSEERWVRGGERLELKAARLSPEAFARLEPERLGHEDLERAAERYARFDLARSKRVAPDAVADPEAMRERLRELHYQALQRPDDSDRRVALAKAQLDVQAAREASYNLNRAGVRTEQEMRRHRIDPARLKAPATPDPFALIEHGRHHEAIAIFEQRLEAGSATARDVCGLARAHLASEGKSRRAVGYAERAVFLASDGTLPEDELRLCRFLAPNL